MSVLMWADTKCLRCGDPREYLQCYFVSRIVMVELIILFIYLPSFLSNLILFNP